MRPITALLTATVLAVGLGGGAAAYRMASVPAETTRAAAVTVPRAEPAPAATPAPIRKATRFRWAPCKPPAVRQGRACVTEVVRTVVLAAPAAPAPVVVPAASHSSGVRPASAGHEPPETSGHGDDGNGQQAEPEHSEDEHGDDGGEHDDDGGEHDDDGGEDD